MDTPGSADGDLGSAPGWGSIIEDATDLLGPLVAELDADRLTGGDAVRLYRSFVAVERLGLAGKTILARRIEESGVWRHSGHRNAAALVAELEGVSAGQARSVIEVGKQLTQLPATEEAVRQGRLSGPKVAQLVGAGILDPTREGELLEGAAAEPLEVVKQRCGRARATSAAKDPVKTMRRIRAERFFSSWIDAEGAFWYQGMDTPDRGAQILNHIGAEADRLRKERKERGEQASERDRAVRADAFFGLVTGLHPDGPVAPPADPTPGRRSRSSSDGTGDTGRAAGATRLASDIQPLFDPDLDPEGLTSHDGDGDGSGSGGGREDGGSGQPSPDALTIIDRPPTCTVMVRIDLDALLRGRAEEGELCEIDGQGPIPVPMARDLLNDSFLRLVFHRSGDIRSVYHFNRTINRTLRTALVFRDTTCVVPGCRANTRLEIDHIIPVTEHGPTTLDNLALLCHHHHFLKTFEGWTLERVGTDRKGKITWRFEPEASFGEEPDLGIDTPEARTQWHQQRRRRSEE